MNLFDPQYFAWLVENTTLQLHAISHWLSDVPGIMWLNLWQLLPWITYKTGIRYFYWACYTVTRGTNHITDVKGLENWMLCKQSNSILLCAYLLILSCYYIVNFTCPEDVPTLDTDAHYWTTADKYLDWMTDTVQSWHQAILPSMVPTRPFFVTDLWCWYFHWYQCV